MLFADLLPAPEVRAYAPNRTFWLLVIIIRKFAIIYVAISLSFSPMLQARFVPHVRSLRPQLVSSLCTFPSLSVAIMFIAYSLQLQFRPFLEQPAHQKPQLPDPAKAVARPAHYHVAENRLEAGYLACGMLTLLSGMVFQSGSILVGSRTYWALTVLVSAHSLRTIIFVLM